MVLIVAAWFIVTAPWPANAGPLLIVSCLGFPRGELDDHRELCCGGDWRLGTVIRTSWSAHPRSVCPLAAALRG